MLTSGRKWAVLTGSHGAHHYPSTSVSRTTYVRAGGVATIVTQSVLPMKAGQPFRVACNADPNAEGEFVLLVDSAPEAAGSRLTWSDPRPDRSIMAGPGTILDKRAWMVGQAFMSYANAILGNPADIIYMASTGGASYSDWLHADRKAQLAAQAPFDATFHYLLGNAVLSGGSSAEEIVSQAREMLDFMRPLSRVQYIVTPPAIRNISPDDGQYARGSRLIREIAAALPRLDPALRVLHVGEWLAESWSPYDVATPENVSNGWPDANDMNPDGTHLAFGAAIATGYSIALEANAGDAQLRPALPRSMSDCVQRAAGLDFGNAVTNLLPSFAGQVTTAPVATDGCTGIAPEGGVVTLILRGGASAASDLETHEQLGSRWVVTVTDNAPSSQGARLRMEYAPAGLLEAVQARQGQLADLELPVSVVGARPQTLVFAEAGLYAVIDGVEHILCECISDRGNNGHQLLGRTLDGGFSLPLRAPRVPIPAGVFTSVVVRIAVRHVPGVLNPQGPGTYQVCLGPSPALDVFPSGTYFDGVSA